MKQLTKFLNINARLTSKETSLLVFAQVTLLFLVWNFSSSTLFPKPTEIAKALVDLVLHQRVLENFMLSVTLCCKCLLIAVAISLALTYLSVIPFFQTIASFITRLRFLPTAGLIFVAMKLSDTVNEQKTLLMVFGITVFFITATMAIIGDVQQGELNYPRTLRFPEWKVVLEVQILGRLPLVYDAIRQNFAMAWMMIAFIEGLCKSDGGIGVILSDQNKYFKFDYVWAIQLLILLTGMLIDYVLRKAKKSIFPYLQ